MPKTDAYDRVHALALEQHGIITAEQAVSVGVSKYALVKMAKRGRLARVSFGLYRDTAAPETKWTEYMKAVLWPQGVVGVLSHETALDLMDISDVNPNKIHVTVPRDHRVRRRKPPAGMILHHASLTDEEIGSIEGIPVTKAARAIRDCAQQHLGPALLRQALDDGMARGWLTKVEAQSLLHEFQGSGIL